MQLCKSYSDVGLASVCGIKAVIGLSYVYQTYIKGIHVALRCEALIGYPQVGVT